MLAQVRKGIKGFVEVPIGGRLAANTQISATCHLWAGGIGRTHGYGHVWYKGKSYRVHRLVWELANGPIPKGFEVCHSCDVRHCVNLASGVNAHKAAKRAGVLPSSFYRLLEKERAQPDQRKP